jgi:orotate phosphoribosyltransferase
MRPMGYVVDPLATLRELGGFYKCPRDTEGKRLGPLVGYAGRDGQGRQYVGDIYANFAKAEQVPAVMDLWAQALIASLALKHRISSFDVFLGMPMGGILFAAALARSAEKRVAFAEKKIVSLATEHEREQSKLVLGRHDLEPKWRVVLVEDVVNNFSTTKDAIRLVNDQGAIVAAVVCILNRSGRDTFGVGPSGSFSR